MDKQATDLGPFMSEDFIRALETTAEEIFWFLNLIEPISRI